MDANEKIELIRYHVPYASRLEALAEEATELAQAALKLARVLRGENPTPVTYPEAHKLCTEESADVLLCLAATGMDKERDIDSLTEFKLNRWLERLEIKYEED